MHKILMDFLDYQVWVKKTAERMIAELSEAFNNFAQFSTDLSSTKNVRDALEALETLGVSKV